MRYLTILFLFAVIAAQAQVKTTYCATEYHDIISDGDYENPSKAIRCFADDTGFTVVLIGNLGITTGNILDCLAKESGRAFTVEVQAENEIRIEPTDLGMEKTYQLFSRLILDKYGVKRVAKK